MLNKAGQARDDTIVGGEKEQVELAYISAAVKNLGGNVTGQNLQDELDASVGENKTTVTGNNMLKVKFEDTQNVYKVSQDGKVEKKNNNPNILEISVLNENASTYFGWDVINYAETLPAELQDTKWQLFYAGSLDGEMEERIYLISKDYVKNILLPAKNGVTPIAIDGSDYKAKFSEENLEGGIIQQYTGSVNITETKFKKLNSKYFKWLTDNEQSSENPNIKVTAYMMDSNIWNSFATSSNNYAEYAIGGPTLELLFKAYNKYASVSYEADVPSEKGYQVRANSTDAFSSLISNAIKNDEDTIDNPYSVSNNSNANGYWLSSPSNGSANIIRIVNKSGNISTGYYYSTGIGFRPLILLKSEFTLEKTKDSNGNDAFKIVSN